MNYLAHAYLSFGNSQVLAGNMISDFVKGKKKYEYPALIQKGITLHRAIDQFTDEHDCTRMIKAFFRPAYQLYAGAFADVVYDYFLANDRNEFPSPEALMYFTQHTFKQLEEQSQWHGTIFGNMFPYMKEQNWLYNYQYEWGIQKSMEGLRRRAKHIEETDTAFRIFLTHKEEMQPVYTLFFHSVKNFAAHTMEDLLNG
ncbi:MAG: ACP phosphodiesterase [Ferruginibacter sp.]